MKSILSNQIKKILRGAKKSDLEISIKEVPDNSDMILIANPELHKVVLLVIDQLSIDKKSLRAFTINLKKWSWAETEGFTEKDLLGRLGDQVFREVSLNEIVKKLS